MSIFNRKKSTPIRDIYSFAGVGQENVQAKSIQSNIDILRYLASHRVLGSREVAEHLDRCERAGMGVHPRKAEVIEAAGSMSADQAEQLRSALAATHIEELAEIIKTLGATASPTAETVKMIQFARDEVVSLGNVLK